MTSVLALWKINARFFYKQHFYKQCQAETGKNKAKAKQHAEVELLLFENYSFSSYTFFLTFITFLRCGPFGYQLQPGFSIVLDLPCLTGSNHTI